MSSKNENKDNSTSLRDSDTTKKKKEIVETDDVVESLLRLAFPLYAALSWLSETSNFQTARGEDEDRSHDNGDDDIAFSNIKDDDDVAVCRTDSVPTRDI